MVFTFRLCVLYGSQNKLQLLYTINWLVFFISKVVTVYCAVGTESYKPDYVLSLKGYVIRILSSSATRRKQPNGARVLLVIICYECIQ